MIIISWDVGVIYLAYCVLEYIINENSGKVSVKIIDWNVINLIDGDRLILKCCGKKKKDGSCDKNASFCLKTGDDKIYGFCKTHLVQYHEYWSEKETIKLFDKSSKPNKCDYVKKNGECCGKKTGYIYQNDTDKIYYCTSHYKSQLGKKIKEYSPQPIRNMIVKKYPTSQLQLNLIKKLDDLSKHFAKLNIEEVIIENQPSQKNPKMKSIANTLFDYFLIRGYIDKIHKMDIKLVKFMCPSNKLKVNNNNTLEVFKANKDSKKKYKLTKKLGIQYTKQLLCNNKEQLEYLSLYDKEDDLCDAYLQGRYYLEFIRNKSPGLLKCEPESKSDNKKNKSDSENKSHVKSRNISVGNSIVKKSSIKLSKKSSIKSPNSKINRNIITL
ncbi:hypothetical protein QLL95_gp1033 [Cotonvirus japonicus]|uniref:Holliday junction resolvase n=1 Tax=Cotonvirus japonicus TaxID=2811091 RepID=A0ABM7NSF2_9VIRU|nr:hypothetical protein QLL95_gp1033 [Cotonvirus japonicus]BCS83090.1 hypothetical protein [Cotonvirus japonicus]